MFIIKLLLLDALQFQDLIHRPVQTIVPILLATLVGNLWESVWLWILSSTYDKLSLLQRSKLELSSRTRSPSWRLILTIMGCMVLRFAIRLWGSGKWITIVLASATRQPDPKTPAFSDLGLRMVASSPQLLVPPSLEDLRHPLYFCFCLLLSSLAASLWEDCFVYLSKLIKAIVYNSSSSSSVPSMARDQAGIRKWTTKIALTCRFGLFYFLTLLEWGGWTWVLVMCVTQDGTWSRIPETFIAINTVIAKALIVDIILEKIFNKQWRSATPFWTSMAAL